MSSLFLVSYKVTTPGVGGPLLTLHLTVDSEHETIHGLAEITQATNPPLEIKSKLDGNFTYMTVMSNKTNILVICEGWPIINLPKDHGMIPLVSANFELRMILEENWKEGGIANYKYRDDDGNWQVVKNAKVELEDSPVLK